MSEKIEKDNAEQAIKQEKELRAKDEAEMKVKAKSQEEMRIEAEKHNEEKYKLLQDEHKNELEAVVERAKIERQQAEQAIENERESRTKAITEMNSKIEQRKCTMNVKNASSKSLNILMSNIKRS